MDDSAQTTFQSPLVELIEADIANTDSLVLSKVNLRILPGEFVYLIGKVGSGKTSIIRTLIGEIPLRKGTGTVGKFTLQTLKKREIPYLRRSIGVIFQDFQLLMDRTVHDNLSFVLRSTGWKQKKKMEERIQEVLRQVGMQTKAHKMPHQLSGGEQQRIAIARALLNKPALILADEPTGNLDNDTASDIMDLLMELHRHEQTAFLMVTHNRQLFKTYPGRIIVCEKGTLNEEKDDYGDGIDLTDLNEW
ncbi:MAG: ATP-binding cassette domain-containing protein [Bacteroidales bacterium]|nr:ATP-binding cassette domain-containing protein [Bacteroidales bacterium]